MATCSHVSRVAVSSSSVVLAARTQCVHCVSRRWLPAVLRPHHHCTATACQGVKPTSYSTARPFVTSTSPHQPPHCPDTRHKCSVQCRAVNEIWREFSQKFSEKVPITTDRTSHPLLRILNGHLNMTSPPEFGTLVDKVNH